MQHLPIGRDRRLSLSASVYQCSGSRGAEGCHPVGIRHGDDAQRGSCRHGDKDGEQNIRRMACDKAPQKESGHGVSDGTDAAGPAVIDRQTSVDILHHEGIDKAGRAGL